MADVTPPPAEKNAPSTAPIVTGSRPSYRRLTSALAGGVVGGVIVLGLGFLVVPEMIQRRVDQAVARIALDPSIGQRLSALEQEVSPLAGLPETLTAQGQKLDTMGGDLAGIGGRLTEAGGRLDDLERLAPAQAALSERIAALENAPAPQAQDLGPIQAQVAAAAATAADLRALAEQLGGRVEDLTALQDGTVRRVDTLSAAVAETERRMNTRSEQIGDRLAAAEAALSGKLADLAKAESALADLQATLAAQSARLASIDENAARAASTAEAAASSIDGRIGAAEKALAERFARDERGMATAMALSELARALDDGSPFPTAQAVLETASAGDAPLSEATALLRGSAALGVASRAALLAELTALDAPAPGVTPSSEDWVEQTRQNILGLVTVKRRDGTTTTTPAATGDAVQLLESGDLAGAIAIIQARADASSEPVAAWIGRAEARRDAEAAQSLLRQRLGELLIRQS